MNKCLRITLNGDFPEGFLHDVVQKKARMLELEGTGQSVISSKQLRVIICGSKEGVDEFLDMLIKGTAQWSVHDVEVEPFLKEKDYRGVFRVIE